MDFGVVMFPTEYSIQPDELARALEAMAAASVSRAIFGLPSEPRDAVLPRLDSYAAVLRSM